MNFINLLTLAEVLNLLGVGKTKIYGEIQKGTFPPPVKIGSCSRWPAPEVRELIAAYVRSASEEELVHLVSELVARRTAE